MKYNCCGKRQEISSDRLAEDSFVTKKATFWD